MNAGSANCECTAGEYRETCPITRHTRLAYSIRARREQDPIGTSKNMVEALEAKRAFIVLTVAAHMRALDEPSFYL